MTPRIAQYPKDSIQDLDLHLVILQKVVALGFDLQAEKVNPAGDHMVLGFYEIRFEFLDTFSNSFKNFFVFLILYHLESNL